MKSMKNVFLSVALLMLPLAYSWAATVPESAKTVQPPAQQKAKKRVTFKEPLAETRENPARGEEQQPIAPAPTSPQVEPKAEQQKFANPQEEAKILAQAQPEDKITKYDNLEVVGCKNTHTGQFIDPDRKLANDYPQRAQVPEDKRSWTVAYPEYNLPYPLFPNLDQAVWRKARMPLAQAPLNPCGRTGIAGRGVLGSWGENPAADSIITRYHPLTGKLTVLLLLRTDGSWAIPGGMQDPNEPKLSAVASRELQEETGHKIDMGDAKEIYSGYSDDWRNTDNAWITTAAFHKHLDNQTSKIIGTKKTDEVIDPTEVRKVRWIDYDNPKLENLFASHAKFVKQALDSKTEKQIEPLVKEIGTQTGEPATVDVGTQTTETKDVATQTGEPDVTEAYGYTTGYTTGYATGYTTR